MFVQGLGQLHYESQIKPGNRAKQKQMPLPQDKEKTISKTETTTERTDLIDSIKKKIKSGFYNSEGVLEDLSNSFAKALDQTL